MSVLDSPLVVLVVVVAGVVVWWRLTRGASWDAPGDPSTQREKQERYRRAQAQADKEQGNAPPR